MEWQSLRNDLIRCVITNYQPRPNSFPIKVLTLYSINSLYQSFRHFCCQTWILTSTNVTTLSGTIDYFGIHSQLHRVRFYYVTDRALMFNPKLSAFSCHPTSYSLSEMSGSKLEARNLSKSSKLSVSLPLPSFAIIVNITTVIQSELTHMTSQDSARSTFSELEALYLTQYWHC